MASAEDDIQSRYSAGTTRYKSKHLISTESTRIQTSTENECQPFFIHIPSLDPSSKADLVRLGMLKEENGEISPIIQLLREKHVKYANRPYTSPLPGSYISLDSSKPWIVYWTLHSLDLLDALPEEEDLCKIVSSLEACFATIQCNEKEGGGFGGSNRQIPHCATTYAAVNALSIIAGCSYSKVSSMAIELLESKRKLLYNWYISLREERIEDGALKCGYRMHHNGEVDVRATYCVFSVCRLLNILNADLIKGAMEHVVDCQTYEGGFGGEPFTESHGGYTFCAMAALMIIVGYRKDLNALSDCGVDVDALRDWIVYRQMGYEGGFQGRANKLVDGCYSFWVGGAVAMLGVDMHKSSTFRNHDSGIYSEIPDDIGMQRLYDDATSSLIDCEEGGLLCDQKLLQRYVLLCAQDVNGGLRDKPSKPRDFYHTCYNLSGLSASQHVLSSKPKNLGKSVGDGKLENDEATMYENEPENILHPTHPVYNIRVHRALQVISHFQKLEQL